jgi:large subunit ribosomal protein L6
MSRIGKLPIGIAKGVDVKIDGNVVSVKGPKGSLSQDLPGGISAELADGQLLVKRKDDSKVQRSLHGLSRALLANCVTGVSSGFAKELEIQGVGYTADLKGKTVQFKLGYSHPIEFPVPAGIEIKVDRNKLTVSGCDRQQVGQVAAEIRALRAPDVYKLKGIRYVGEHLRKKAGKAGGK